MGPPSEELPSATSGRACRRILRPTVPRSPLRNMFIGRVDTFRSRAAVFTAYPVGRVDTFRSRAAVFTVYPVAMRSAKVLRP